MRRRKTAGVAGISISSLLASLLLPPTVCAQSEYTNEKQRQVVEYSVREGDSLYKLSNQFHTTISLLSELNHLPASSTLQIGQTLTLIPFSESSDAKVYDVKPGDTIWGIAQTYHTTLDRVVPENQSQFAGILQPGAKVYVLQNNASEETNINKVVTASAEPFPMGLSQGPPLVYAKSLVCKLTAYGPGFESTGKNPGDPGYGITASGQVARENQTIAVDPQVIPMGSLVFIEGLGYRKAEDIGGAIKGNRIDVFFSDANKAIQFGVRDSVKVFLVK